MTDDLLLREALDLLVPAEPVANEWPDVLARAAGGRRPRMWYRRARKSPVLALVILAVVVAIPVTAVAGPKPWWSLFRSSAPPALRVRGGPTVVIDEATWNGTQFEIVGYRGAHGFCTELGVGAHGSLSPHGGACGGSIGSTVDVGGKSFRLSIGFGEATLPAANGKRFELVSGEVSESARTVRITLGNGTVINTTTFLVPAALGTHDRYYVAEIPASTIPLWWQDKDCAARLRQAEQLQPRQLVALDSTGVTVGKLNLPIPLGIKQRCEPPRNEFVFPFPANYPAVDRKLTTVERVTGPYGATATVATGVTVPIPTGQPLPNGTVKHLLVPSRCWKVSFSDGQSTGSCTPFAKTVLNPDYWLAVQHAGRDTLLVIQARPRVGNQAVRITFQLEDGHVLSKTPIDGIVVFAIPRYDLTTRSQHGFIVGYDARGHPIAVRLGMTPEPTANGQIVYYRSCPPGSSCYD